MSTYPLPDAAAIARHYAKNFEVGNYALHRSYIGPYSRVYREYVQFLVRAMRVAGIPVEGARVLDIGCYTGDFLCEMERAGADVYGAELQPEAVAIASRKLPGRIHRVDVMDRQVSIEPCHAVTLLGVIEHVTDPMALLASSVRLLRPGGVLLIETPDSTAWLARLLRKFWPPYAPIEHIHLFARRSLTYALTKLGMTHVEIRRHSKHLPVSYVYANLKHFGPELQAVLRPFYGLLPSRIADNLVLPFYVGEVLVTARKPPR